MTAMRLQWWVIGPCPLELEAHRAVFLARAWAKQDEVRYVYPANVLFLFRSKIHREGHGLPGDWGRWSHEGSDLHHTSRVGQDVPPVSRLWPMPGRWWVNKWPVGCWLFPASSWLSEWRFGRWLRREMARFRREGLRQVIVNFWWGLSWSLRLPVADRLVYDCADHFRAYPGEIPERIDWNENRLARLSDLVVVSSLSFAPRLRTQNANVVHVPNGVSQELFDRVVPLGVPARDCAGARPVIINHGIASAWRFDWDLYCAVAGLCPDYEFRIYTKGHHLPDRLALPPNARLLGWLPPQDFADVLRECALGFMPYVLQEPTMSGFPLKMFEYLAAGLPVVSTRLHEVARFADHVTLCDSDPVQTAGLIRQEIERDSMERRQRRRALAEQYTWRSLADEYRAIVLGELPSPRTSPLPPRESARP